MIPAAAGDSWFLTGATASGKTGLALELARRLDGEIVSLDSMALYRGLDIGTAKPSPSERRAVPHHLIDVIEPSDEFSLARYVEAAEASVTGIYGRGRTPIFAGGTPLYLKSLLRGIFVGPPADWKLRLKLEEAANSQPPEWLQAELAKVDPTSAQRLHANDRRRLIRALEVFQLTGTPISELQQQFERSRPAEACRVFVLDWPREALYARIDRRVDAMFAAGLVDEVRTLLARGSTFSRTAQQAVGYREVLSHLAGDLDLSATIDLVKTRTRQFAKRQLTWFRSLSECRWVQVSHESELAGAVEQITELGRKVNGE